MSTRTLKRKRQNCNNTNTNSNNNCSNNNGIKVRWQNPDRRLYFPEFTPKTQKPILNITSLTKRTKTNPNNSGSPRKSRVSYRINEIKTQQKSIEENMCIDIKKREKNELEKYEQIYNQHRELLDKKKEKIDNLLGKIENERTEFIEQKTEEIEKFRKQKNKTNNNVYKFRNDKRVEINSFIKKQEQEYQKYLQFEIYISNKITILLQEYINVRNEITTHYDNECKEEKRNKQNNLNKLKKELNQINSNTNKNENRALSHPPFNIFSPASPASPAQQAQPVKRRRNSQKTSQSSQSYKLLGSPKFNLNLFSGDFPSSIERTQSYKSSNNSQNSPKQ
jgi:hypothetical protein